MDESRPWRQLGGGGGLWWCAAVFPPEKMQVTFLTKGQLRVANQWLEELRCGSHTESDVGEMDRCDTFRPVGWRDSHSVSALR